MHLTTRPFMTDEPCDCFIGKNHTWYQYEEQVRLREREEDAQAIRDWEREVLFSDRKWYVLQDWVVFGPYRNQIVAESAALEMLGLRVPVGLTESMLIALVSHGYTLKPIERKNSNEQLRNL